MKHRCLNCKADLTGSSPKRLYCDNNEICANMYRYRRTKKIKCAYCGKKKDKYIHFIDKTKDQYCDYSCAAKGRVEKRKKAC